PLTSSITILFYPNFSITFRTFYIVSPHYHHVPSLFSSLYIYITKLYVYYFIFSYLIVLINSITFIVIAFPLFLYSFISSILFTKHMLLLSHLSFDSSYLSSISSSFKFTVI